MTILGETSCGTRTANYHNDEQPDVEQQHAEHHGDPNGREAPGDHPEHPRVPDQRRSRQWRRLSGRRRLGDQVPGPRYASTYS